MYVDEHLVDSAEVSPNCPAEWQSQLIKDAMQHLLQKHKEALAATDQRPHFFLEGVPSRINHFQSLKDQYGV